MIEEEQPLVPLVKDLEVRGKADQGGVLPEDPLAHRVVGGHPGIQGGVAHLIKCPIEHLLGRLMGEGEDEELTWALNQPFRDEEGDPAGDDGGLPRPHPGEHKQRPLPMGNRLKLLRVQTRKYVTHPPQFTPLTWEGRGSTKHGVKPPSPPRHGLQRCGQPLL